MHDNAATFVPQEMGALNEHILCKYHEMHRADLASPDPMAERVEQVHADDTEAPKGLADAMTTLARKTGDHAAKEAMILFPAMRANHEDRAETIALMRQLTRDHTPPEHACGLWQPLYGSTATLLNELAIHIALENDVLFPRFEPA